MEFSGKELWPYVCSAQMYLNGYTNRKEIFGEYASITYGASSASGMDIQQGGFALLTAIKMGKDHSWGP